MGSNTPRHGWTNETSQNVAKCKVLLYRMGQSDDIDKDKSYLKTFVSKYEVDDRYCKLSDMLENSFSYRHRI